ncbi:TPA: hypothetical protein ACXJLS_004338, partial [Stenotrophomonas maltophilia]
MAIVAILVTDRRDLGSHGGPRRLSTPTLPDSDQIRLGRRIHAPHGPACRLASAPDRFLRAEQERKFKVRREKQIQKLLPTKVGSYQKQIVCGESHRARGNVSRGRGHG